MQWKRGGLQISHAGHFIISKVPEAYGSLSLGNNSAAYVVCEEPGEGTGSRSRCCCGQGGEVHAALLCVHTQPCLGQGVVTLLSSHQLR